MHLSLFIFFTTLHWIHHNNVVWPLVLWLNCSLMQLERIPVWWWWLWHVSLFLNIWYIKLVQKNLICRQSYSTRVLLFTCKNDWIIIILRMRGRSQDEMNRDDEWMHHSGWVGIFTRQSIWILSCILWSLVSLDMVWLLPVDL